MNSRLTPIFSPKIDDKVFDYHDVITWGTNNLHDENVIPLTIDDIYLLQRDSKLIDIINEEIDGYVEPYENYVIYDKKVKLSLQLNLKNYKLELLDGFIKKTCIQMIAVLEYSIENDRGFYIYF